MVELWLNSMTLGTFPVSKILEFHAMEILFHFALTAYTQLCITQRCSCNSSFSFSSFTKPSLPQTAELGLTLLSGA